MSGRRCICGGGRTEGVSILRPPPARRAERNILSSHRDRLTISSQAAISIRVPVISKPCPRYAALISSSSIRALVIRCPVGPASKFTQLPKMQWPNCNSTNPRSSPRGSVLPFPSMPPRGATAPATGPRAIWVSSGGGRCSSPSRRRHSPWPLGR